MCRRVSNTYPRIAHVRFVVNMQCRMVIRNLIPGMVHMGAFTYAAYMFRYRQSGLDQIEVGMDTVYVAPLR